MGTDTVDIAAKRIETLKEEKPEVAGRLLTLGKEAERMRRLNHISLRSVAKWPSATGVIFRLLLLLATLPYTLAAMLLTLPITATGAILTKKFKDPAFHNSVRFVLQLVLWPLLLIIYAVIVLANMPLMWAVCMLLLIMPAPAVAQDTFRAMRMTVSDLRLLCNRSLMAKYDKIQELFFQ